MGTKPIVDEELGMRTPGGDCDMSVVLAEHAPALRGLVVRCYRGSADLAAMVSVHNQSIAADQVEQVITVKEMATEYAHLINCDPRRDVLLIESGDTLIGYLRVFWRDERQTGIRLYNHLAVLVPDWRRRGIGAAMLALAEARLRQVADELSSGGSTPVLQAFLSDRQVGAAALLTQSGYAPARHEYSMLRPDLCQIPDLPLPVGLEIRPALPEHYRRIWEANNEAFRDHWGYLPMLEQDYEVWRREPSFDPSLWRVAWDGDQVAGMVLGFVNAAENAVYNRLRGYTEDICVRRPWRRRGLARALIACSLRALRARGMSEAALGVDTENISGALGLYESLGYRPIHRWTLYRKPMVGGREQVG
jgi:mycothiol synthase